MSEYLNLELEGARSIDLVLDVAAFAIRAGKTECAYEKGGDTPCEDKCAISVLSKGQRWCPIVDIVALPSSNELAAVVSRAPGY